VCVCGVYVDVGVCGMLTCVCRCVLYVDGLKAHVCYSVIGRSD